ncbi:uroporphyrinogen-III C-methyltransferase [Terasakiella sp. A23]|uniref:uroporphyrinogen-III C-methyltransferase n=1 Tax=Terasakiella sp. FCG-A23 TaxID=3080561 RepID=UPI002953F024|nr:uroporphyrinogen-III C-methyltransferase [Terasakiella sp. A23]MDV7341280.1 uroporphyrinogen-III C-methyltransferase [Terasakiella sp. A23]
MNSEQVNVFLVGSGPGDPDLLTVKAHRLIREAEVVVIDRLVSDQILDIIPPNTSRVYVGKKPGNHHHSQEEINEILVRLGQSGRKVVRLKGGDPYIFGRGSEEAEHLIDNNIPFEVVPGITAAQGCGSLNGIPLTHRGYSTGVRFVTGHRRNDGDLGLNWASLACEQTTLVVYMGVSSIGIIAEKLMENGLPASTPVAAIEKGLSEDERRLTSSLNNIHHDVVEADFQPPTLFIIGKVVSLADKLNWQNDTWETNDEPYKEQRYAAL